MDKTPTLKSQSKYFRNNNQEENTDNLNSSNSKIFESESPRYIPCTQEGFENIDVTWDWNSPQSKKKPKKSQKRLALGGFPKSPRKTLKRHLSNTSIQGFEKIQEELRLLKEEIAIPEHEESLVLSPIEEAEYKNVDESDSIHNIELENFINEAEDFFDDSFDEQLLVSTTQMESQLTSTAIPTQCDIKNNDSNFKKVDNKLQNSGNTHSSSTKMNSNFKGLNNKLQGPSNAQSFSTKTKQHNLSVDVLEDTINFEETSARLGNNRSEISVSSFGKVEFHRTESFEISNETLGGIPLSQKEEIERKRKEALAKLEFKKKQANFTVSPGQCTSEEIERKRQEALAKREARRQQEIIEKNRQNALKRLEITRKKNAQNVKSTLTSRLS